ncbi:cysteine methyltransferase [Cohnella sp. CIP 111063]|uniref:methylated-DNA--[protein]-cysteine S-methyltransferase n=1 Tax=unclassified Cohnella TaxID=2636738 RepID=UPI000B8BFF93|nr:MULTISPECIES: methylated-DNA--[protein]-cysteine S-methyltransferase [unclassified Cohnella]OXS53677.1 cysteine methyltransferase [Cohnella sp. CIP 111063]PRX61957.1 methylated-DNA-[protein]-cysteine S-methyltransferase [Cohnella sp. SGD-V74]
MSENKRYRQTIVGFNRPWTLVATERGVSELIYPPEVAAQAGFTEDYAQLPEAPGLFEQFGIVERLERYFAGEPVSFEGVPLDVRGTPFQTSVWTGLSQIPYGKTLTYKQFSDVLGKSSAVRAVGTAIGRNPLPVVLPCHRVVGSNGTLTGFRGGLQMKRDILALEGVTSMSAAGHDRFRF